MTTHTHLTDDELLDAYLERVPPSDPDAPEPDTDACAVCREQRLQLTALLDEIATTTTALADAAFTPDRLARQRTRILQRIQHAGQQGRVLAFPARAGRTPLLQPRPLRRWIAGAAAAGLVVGMAAGHMVHELPVLDGRPSTAMSARVAPALADDELLREIEAAVGTPLPAGLRRIADVTPAAWEVQ